MAMDCFIKKIFEGKSDNSVHLQFQKFSRGNFTNRALLRASSGSKGYSLWLGLEYANELIRNVAEKLADNKTQVTGVVVSTQKLDGKINYSGLKQFMGIKQYVIESEMSGSEIIKLIDSMPDVFFALSFSVGDTTLKIKPKAPKSAKPKTSGEPPKADFCTLKTNDGSLIDSFIWEKGWKTIEGNHTFAISDIEMPKNISDPNELRRLAKRKGKIIRNLTIDGHDRVIEKEFVA